MFRSNFSRMSVCPHASHFSQTSGGISSRSRRDCLGFFGFLFHQAMGEIWRGPFGEASLLRSLGSLALADGPLKAQRPNGAASPLARDPRQNADRQPTREHERSAVAEERQR